MIHPTPHLGPNNVCDASPLGRGLEDAVLTVVAKDTALCPRCNGDGAVLTHIPKKTESIYGWAGYVPCPHCGGCGRVQCRL